MIERQAAELDVMKALYPESLRVVDDKTVTITFNNLTLKIALPPRYLRRSFRF